MHIHELACVEVGGGSIQTVLFEDGRFEILEGAHQPPDATLALAVPGIIEDGVVTTATNLGWTNTDPVRELGLRGPGTIVLNDAEAAALGEAALRKLEGPLVYIGIGTGIGGAVVRDGVVVRGNLFGHNLLGYGSKFGSAPCRCGRNGCLETVAAGWALPDPIDAAHFAYLATCVAHAVDDLDLATEGLVVVAGGIPRRYPVLADLIASRLHRTVERSAAPEEAKSAAAWGLRLALQRNSRTLTIST
jgi:predicted NBD/HSP70 family sugar kinase